MQSQPNLFTRPDTFFGVCQGLGEDLRIHPNLFRIALAGLLFWNPLAAIGAYAVLALIVGASRWIVPSPKAQPSPAATSVADASADHPSSEQVEETEPVLLAA